MKLKGIFTALLAAARQRGLPVIGGLVSSTILALYVIPALYILFAGRKKKKGPDRAA